MLFWVLKTCPGVCDGNQLIDPELEKCFAPFNFEKIFSTLGIGQVNFLVTLFKVQ